MLFLARDWTTWQQGELLEEQGQEHRFFLLMKRPPETSALEMLQTELQIEVREDCFEILWERILVLPTRPVLAAVVSTLPVTLHLCHR